MEVLGHDDVSDHYKSILLPSSLQDVKQQMTACAGSQLGLLLVTATGYEMEVVSAVPALEALCHVSEDIRFGRVWSVTRGTHNRNSDSHSSEKRG